MFKVSRTSASARVHAHSHPPAVHVHPYGTSVMTVVKSKSKLRALAVQQVLALGVNDPTLHTFSGYCLWSGTSLVLFVERSISRRELFFWERVVCV